MTKIYLVRHAEAEGNLYHRLHGLTDAGVTKNGNMQIAALQKRFSSIELDACYSSDLQRAVVTARALCEAKGLQLNQDRCFRELDFGPLEDLPYGELERHWPNMLEELTNDPFHFQMQGVESYEASTARFLQAMYEIALQHEGESIAIVTHGSVLRNVLIALFFGPDQQKLAAHSDNTAVTLLEFENAGYRLVFANDNGHLSNKISTIAKQNWWKEGTKKDYNLWFQPFDLNHDVYCEMRRDAWQTIYGSQEGLDAEGFYQELCNIMQYHRYAAAYAMLDDKIAGFIQLAPARNRERGVGYVSFVYLCPEFRNKGIGAQLIGYAVSEYRKQGRAMIQLGCARCNLHGQHFYRKMGFEVVGTTPGLQADLLLEQLALTPQTT